MVEQFWEKEEMRQMFKGFEATRGKTVAAGLVHSELLYLNEIGDIFIFDRDITGAIVGLPAKKLLTFQRLLIALSSNKILRALSNDEINLLKENTKLIKEVHSGKWYKKYCKNPYYLSQFGISKEKRGQGIARTMLEELFECAGKNHNHMVLETLTASNVPLYEHFGFTVKESFETKNGKLKEYRMIKAL